MAGTAMRHPGLMIPYSCDNSGVVAGSVLVPSPTNADAVALPAAANATSVVGLAYQKGDPSNANQMIEVVRTGVWPGVTYAGGGITAGQYLVVSSSAGDLQPVTSATPPLAAVVGQAQETTNAGETVSVLLTPGLTAGAVIAASGGSFSARGVCTSNMSLTAFVGVTGGTAQDGITYVAGDRVLLVSQTTGSQNGLYVVGAVAAGTAPLTLAPEWAQGQVKAGAVVKAGPEGTAWGNSEWKITATPTSVGLYITVGTTDPLFYPRMVTGTKALTSASPSTGTVSNLFALATTSGLSLVDQTAASAIKGVLTAGRGSGSLALTGPNTVTDSILYTILNW